MRTVTFVFALVLIALGVGLYFGTGRESVTALIPAFIGVGFAICAALARTERSRMHAMHAAAVLALLGAGGGVPGLISLFKGGDGAPTYGRAALTVLCIVFLVLAVRSFIQARRARQASDAS